MKAIIYFLKRIRQLLSLLILKIFGWKAIIKYPKNIKKAVVLGAPHTSYWDTFWMILIGWGYLPFQKCYALFKMEANKSFWGRFYRFIGGIPIDRNKILEESKNQSTVKIVSNKIRELDECFLLLSPEGTRKLNQKWKTGFYYIALSADVPIILGKIDYKLKILQMEDVIYPTGDFKKDMAKINEIYKGISAKYPKKFSLHKIE